MKMRIFCTLRETEHCTHLLLEEALSIKMVVVATMSPEPLLDIHNGPLLDVLGSLGVVCSGVLLVVSKIRSGARVHIFDRHDGSEMFILVSVNFQTRELVIYITKVTITIEFLLEIVLKNFLFLVFGLPGFLSKLVCNRVNSVQMF